ncbi:MAG: hypothetical protein ACTSWE_07185 [Promethearchaeota archaeon]
MEDWGPFEHHEGKWLIFSIGNPEEGHGYALPRNIDDLFAQRVAHLISCKTGSRYCAHIPWATDNFVSIARDWAPRIIPVEELVENIKKFIKYFIDIYKEMGLPASRVFIITGHGGNYPLIKYAEEIRSALGLEKVLIGPSENLAEENMERILRELDELSKKLAKEGVRPNKIKRQLVTILTGAGHAGHFEHSTGAALDVLDENKLKIMNEELEKDFEGALEKWPPLGGLGGFLLAGGKYVESIGTEEEDTHGLWNCLRTLQKLDKGRVKPVKELGELVINLLVEYYSEILLQD